MEIGSLTKLQVELNKWCNNLNDEDEFLEVTVPMYIIRDFQQAIIEQEYIDALKSVRNQLDETIRKTIKNNKENY